MSASPRLLIPALLVTLAAGAAVSALPAVAATSAYKTPASGTWKIQDKFEDTAGGTATIAKKGTSLRNLSLVVGPDQVEACGTGTVKVVGALTIKRVGSYGRPAVGRLAKKTGLIEPISVQLTTPGGKAAGTVEVIFEKDGRSAFTAAIVTGECRLPFALRK